MTVREFGESINEAGRGFKQWFTDFTLVYTPIFVLVGILMTGMDVYLDSGIANSLAFKIPWALVQVLAVDGLWFAVWIRILTDEYKWKWAAYHAFIILIGVTMTGIGIIMQAIVFFQQALNLSSSLTSMKFIGIPLDGYLLTRAILLMATATLAILLDKVMRSNPRYVRGTTRKSSVKPAVPEPGITIVPADKPAVLALPEPTDNGVHQVDGLALPKGLYRARIKDAIMNHIRDDKPYTYKDLVNETGASLQTVKLYAPKIKQELEKRTN
jgi:hypothetical protein